MIPNIENAEVGLKLAVAGETVTQFLDDGSNMYMYGDCAHKHHR